MPNPDPEHHESGVSAKPSDDGGAMLDDLGVRTNDATVETWGDEQKKALIAALESLWAYGADRHPAPARALNLLRYSLGLPQVEYRS